MSILLAIGLLVLIVVALLIVARLRWQRPPVRPADYVRDYPAPWGDRQEHD